MASGLKEFWIKIAITLISWGSILAGRFAYLEYKISAVSDEQVARSSVSFVQNKLEILDLRSPIIIGGDSRAQRQIIPAVISRETGLNSINLAAAAMDLFSTYNMLKTYGNLDSGRIYILSASLFQANDGARELPNMTVTHFFNMTPMERAVILRDYYFNEAQEFLKIINLYGHFKIQKKRSSLNETEKKTVADAGSDLADIGTPECKKVNPMEPMGHPWYKNIDVNNARWRITQDAINLLAGHGKSDVFIIYNGPISPKFKDCIQGSVIEKAEIKYSAEMKNFISKNTNNIVFIDFFRETPTLLKDDMFYDIQHLNRRGAEQFSKILANIIKINPITKAALQNMRPVRTMN